MRTGTSAWSVPRRWARAGTGTCGSPAGGSGRASSGRGRLAQDPLEGLHAGGELIVEEGVVGGFEEEVDLEAAEVVADVRGLDS